MLFFDMHFLEIEINTKILSLIFYFMRVFFSDAELIAFPFILLCSPGNMYISNPLSWEFATVVKYSFVQNQDNFWLAAL